MSDVSTGALDARANIRDMRAPGLRRGLRRLARISGAEPRIAVRETENGYTIEEPLTLKPLCRRDRWRLALAAVAIVAATGGAWLVSSLAAPGAAPWLRGLVSAQAGVLAAVAILIALLRGTYRVEIDQRRRRFRFSRRIAWHERRLGDQPFGTAGDIVMRRDRAGHVTLWLRARGTVPDGWHCIALGPEDELRALYRRIARDLEPLEARTAMAVGPRAGRPRTRRGTGAAFPALGPHELARP